MEILVVGLSHKTAPVDIRERLSFPAKNAADLRQAFLDRGIFEEQVLLSTCNRTEIYGVGKSPERSIRLTKEFLSEFSSLELSSFEDKLYILRQPDSVEHLFAVASGLDSMVVGETEITGQVKEAYLEAHRCKHTGKVLNNLFQRSFKVAKNVRTKTEIGAGRVSVASVAVDLSEKIFEDLRSIKVMVVGTGEMATQVARALVSRGAFPLIVSSRHLDRAQELALELGGEAVAYECYEERIAETDILIASTLAPKVLVHQDQVRGWMKARHQKPLFMIDIAVPRNIDTAVGDIDDVYLYNIDDLEAITTKNLKLRRGGLEAGLRLVKDQRAHFMSWLGKEFRASPVC